MMAESAHFKCLRCGHQYVGDYTPKVVEEKTCPKCGSNSVRRVKAPTAAKEPN
jgi:predicted  nucleic acid-binding Zn-ribbon protein